MEHLYWPAWAAVAVALINMLGSVLLAWIRARYNVHETPLGAPGGEVTIRCRDLGKGIVTEHTERITTNGGPTTRPQGAVEDRGRADPASRPTSGGPVHPGP